MPSAAAAPTPVTLDLKTVYSGAMADPAEFNEKVKVFFFSPVRSRPWRIRTA